MHFLGRWSLRRCRILARAHPYAADGLLAVVLYTITVIVPTNDHTPAEWSHLNPRLVLAVAGIPVFAPLAWRRRYPVAVLAVCVIGTLGLMYVGPVRGPILLGSALAVYTVSSVVERRSALTIGAVSVLILGGTSMRLSPEVWDRPVNAIAFVWTALAVAVGEAV